MNIQDLIDKLLHDPAKDNPFRSFNSCDIAFIQSVILSWWALEQERENKLVKEKAALEAKVFAYEEIIANSNFAPLIKPSTIGFCKDIEASKKEV